MKLHSLFKSIALKMPLVGKIIAKSDAFRRYQAFPAGHYYSPISDIDDLRANSELIWQDHSNFPGIDLNQNEQLIILERFKNYYAKCPFCDVKAEGQRYYFENGFYSYSDAIILFCMIMDLKPSQIIEVGSGFSSGAILDTNELFFENRIELTCIEPYPDRLVSLLKPDDIENKRLKIIRQKVQDVELSEFKKLNSNDVIFIDSSHVAKIGSDVNKIIFEILPSLNSGVYIHFHDIFRNFHYPKEWVYKGIGWNECYLIRAFLQYNSAFEVILMNTYMEHFHRGFFEQNMPKCLKNEGGSLWVRKR